MLAVETMLYKLLLRVDLVQNGIGVVLVAGSEDDDLPFLGHLLQEG